MPSFDQTTSQPPTRSNPTLAFFCQPATNLATQQTSSHALLLPHVLGLRRRGGRGRRVMERRRQQEVVVVHVSDREGRVCGTVREMMVGCCTQSDAFERDLISSLPRVTNQLKFFNNGMFTNA